MREGTLDGVTERLGPIVSALVTLDCYCMPGDKDLAWDVSKSATKKPGKRRLLCV